MKNRFKQIILSGAFLFSLTLITNAQIKETYTGDWKFEAPNAPEGSKNGSVVIKTDAIIMSFDEFMQFPSQLLKVVNDSILYEVAFDDTTVRFALKVNDANNMTGKAVWDDGETPIMLTKKIVGVKL
ncbi:MAG: hypothetical protein ACM3NR_00330 [Methanosarcina sp.]